MMTFCTLFNVNYLDKGLALYHSLELLNVDFYLYVLAMDDQCYSILKKVEKKNLIPIKLSDFETDELLKVKPKRSRGEYFWTCSPWIVSYVLDTYSPSYCTYVDADIFIYSDPHVIIDEMESSNSSVQVVSHHFIDIVRDSMSNIVGKYCVEFNTFKNDSKGRMLLDIWKKNVLDRCSLDGDGVYWGDQKYLDNWVQDYDFVMETKNVGAGVAPWNISQYKFYFDKEYLHPKVYVERFSKKAPLLFYHFENIKYIDDSTVNASLVISWGIKKKWIDALYIPYLQYVKEIKSELKNKYGVEVLIKSHPGVEETKQKKRKMNILTRIYIFFFVTKKPLFSLKYKFYMRLPIFFYRKYSIISF